MTSSGPKRTKMQIAQDRARAAELNADGATEQEIANIIGVTQQQIHYDLVKVRDAYKERANDAVAKRAAVFDARNELLYQESYEKWLESQIDRTETTIKTITLDDGERTEEIIKTIQYIGDVQFLRECRQFMAEYAKFHGLYAPAKSEVTTIADPEHPSDIAEQIKAHYAAAGENLDVTEAIP